jgi:hypothetical protein
LPARNAINRFEISISSNLIRKNAWKISRPRKRKEKGATEKEEKPEKGYFQLAT